MLFNDPKTFREDMLKGYVAANGQYITAVSGGVVRVTETPEGKVAVINGGGSGHFPAFCGIVGEGFMDGTVVGNIFTSPSTDDVYHVAKAVENGSGIFIVGGNYAGDKMNFNLARDRLIAEGIDARTFYITDDIASASPEEWEKRRGNVGTFTVFKTAGAAAAAGCSFDEVVRVTEKANLYTRTMSIGLKGCTMPGASEPMFHVPEGKMEVGQGIHGEPGVGESELLSAKGIAELLVSRVLAEAPQENTGRIAVILDGLGTTKYEELFVLYGTVEELLRDAGYTIVEPQVGELVTSLDMAGVALSVTWLDEELEKYWCAPADTPAFKKGNANAATGSKRKIAQDDAKITYKKGSEGAYRAAKAVLDALEKARKTITVNEPELGRIDAIAGDGDHGRGMLKGITFALEAAKEAFEAEAGVGSLLAAAGDAWASKAGGTSGVLWGAALRAAGETLGDEGEGYGVADAAKAVKAALDKMMTLGGAKKGDKTMLDVLIPFAKALSQSAEKGEALREAWESGAKIAFTAADETRNLTPKVGRARPQAARSLGTPDAGAVSMAMCISSAIE